MVQGMMVALVCGAAFLTGCSSKDGEKTVSVGASVAVGVLINKNDAYVKKM